MSQILHLSKLGFLNRINEIAFQQNKKPIEVEQQYYFSLLWKLIQQYMTKVVFDKSYQDDFIIDGNLLNIHQNFLDWKFLCNYLFNMFETYKLRFDFNLTNYNERDVIRCVLYYESILDEKTKSISFILLSDKTAVHNDENNSDSSSSSGGNSLERIKLDIKAMKNFAEKAPKLISQKIEILNDKQFKNFINKKYSEFNFSKKDVGEIKKFSEVVQSVFKNNNLSNEKISNIIKNNINNTFINKPFRMGGEKINDMKKNKSEFPPDALIGNTETKNKTPTMKRDFLPKGNTLPTTRINKRKGTENHTNNGREVDESIIK